jgi:hypothetical protein
MPLHLDSAAAWTVIHYTDTHDFRKLSDETSGTVGAGVQEQSTQHRLHALSAA